MLFFLLFGRGRVFCCLGGGPGPAQTAKKINTPPPKQQKKHAPAPSERVFFLLFGRVGVFIFLLFGRGAFFFFCCLGVGRVLFFAAWARACSFFAVWAGACSFFCCLGPGACFFYFFAVWAGDGSSLTYPSACLVFKRPNNKRDRTAKKNTGSLCREELVQSF